MTRSMIQQQWLWSLGDDVLEFMESLKMGHGRFRPCRTGASAAGLQASLGFSCLAYKIYYSLGLLRHVDTRELTTWGEHIQSFQCPEGLPPQGTLPDAFIDPPLLEAIHEPHVSPMRHLFSLLRPGERPIPPKDSAILAETKQAMATLTQMGSRPLRPFMHFPRTPREMRRRLMHFNWSEPWAAGGKTAALAVFLQAQEATPTPSLQKHLLQVMTDFLDRLADSHTGTYFRGPSPPARGQMINGAMKVLNALEWLQYPIHYPEKLIDTTLRQDPPAAGCHVVDWVYVLHQCSQQTHHRRHEIQDRMVAVIDLIQSHHNDDRGFSYQPHRAQTGYYGATISLGRDEGDIHGTCLLTWALTMIAELLEIDIPGWRVQRP
ncbi:MAG: hypothetical protein HQL73_13180 [Magnetococcales bacterium]|nr:hypothetical protein [Magnetococcales bacterium]